MLYLVTGGSGSGKSEYAEQTICRLCEESGNGRKLYVATMIPYGEETKQKIARHRAMRKEKSFETKECYTDLLGFGQQLKNMGNTYLLLECMSNLIANELFDEQGTCSELRKENPEMSSRDIAEQIVSQVVQGVKTLVKSCKDVVIVTNEVCSEIAIDTEEMKLYKQILGAVNQRLSEEAIQVTEVVYGIPVLQEKETEKMDVYEKQKEIHLIIGGAFQGKLEYAKRKHPEIRWVDGGTCSISEIKRAEGIYHFERYIKKRLQELEKITTENLLEEVKRFENLRVIICDEIGYGLVPVDAFERKYREQTGRICTELAKSAKEVTRVVCGIATRLK